MAYVSSALNLSFYQPLADDGTEGFQTWKYVSADSQATVATANYFTDAQKKGMKVGDQVIMYKTSSTISLISFLVTAVASAGATLTSGTVIS